MERHLLYLPRASVNHNLQDTREHPDVEPAAAEESRTGGDALRAALKEVLALDAEGLLTGSRFKDITAGQLPTAAECSEEFRSVLCAEVAREISHNRARAQAASDLLDQGNAILRPFEQASEPSAVAPPQRTAAANEDDPFWSAPTSHWHKLLTLQARRGPGPVTLYAESESKRKRKLEGLAHGAGKRREVDWRLPKGKGKSTPAGQVARDVQQQLAGLLDQVVEAGAANDALREEHVEEGAGTPAIAIIQRHVQKLQQTELRDALHTLPLEFSDITRSLRRGELPVLDTITQLVAHACQEAGVEAGFGAPGQRAQLVEQSEQLAVALEATLKAAAAQFQREGVVVQRTWQPPSNLPESIQANREPYMQGDWRKQPYLPRPYERLQKYRIVDERRTLEWKMTTQKRSSCSGDHCTIPGQLGTYSLEKEAFQTGCSCLASNTECWNDCGCHKASKKCLNSAVGRRDTLKLDRDVLEVDTWGMDCYTRRNIQDAVLESQAFGPYKLPNYRAAQRSSGLQSLSQGETLQRSTMGAEAGSAPPLPSGREDPSSGKNGKAVDVHTAAAKWIERCLIPTINKQGDKGWDLKCALDEVEQRDGATPSGKAAAAVKARLAKVGHNYFRLHPKGVGLLCARGEGLPPLTFVEEYLGEVHAPWRWFEIQDAIKKSSKDELPDFYNIVLERPRDDPTGYDCLFIDAASKGAFASRMSHSCTPNCQAVVMASRGRLTIAVYTLRHIHLGEELTFDYASVTESEKEFRSAICLCGTANCRGSFLYFSGSKAFMQVMTQRHNLFERHVLILRAGAEPLTADDRALLEKWGVRECALGWGPGRGRVPEWLQKWAALVLEYVEEEQELLPPQLLAIPPPAGHYTPLTAAAEAKGVSDNRLQNVVITLDKIKLCLSKPGQPQDAPLRLLDDAGVIDHLWTGERSVARRVLRAAAQGLSNATVGRTFANAQSGEEIQQALEGAAAFPALQALGKLVLKPVADAAEARAAMKELSQEMRLHEKGHSAIADLLFLYASTLYWFSALRSYKGFVSPPVQLNMKDLALDRSADLGKSPAPKAASKLPNGAGHMATTNGLQLIGSTGLDAEEMQPADADAAGSSGISATVPIVSASRSSGPPPKRKDEPEGEEASAHELGGQEVEEMDGGWDERLMREPTAKQRRGGLCKKYGPWFIWGQLNGWYKQTVYDPTASLSAERRGTVSLPDIECCYGASKARYTAKERESMIDQIEKRPDSMWRTNTMWTFRNETKIYGSPWFDAAWSKVVGGENPLPDVLAFLKAPPRSMQSASMEDKSI